jgi:hypothetical protein
MLDTARMINLFTAVETASNAGESLLRFIGERDERYALAFIFLNDKTAQSLWAENDKVRTASYVDSVFNAHNACVSTDALEVDLWNSPVYSEPLLLNTIKQFEQ